jgi:hypothetical protein
LLIGERPGVQNTVFGGVYFVKRLQPGKVGDGAQWEVSRSPPRAACAQRWSARLPESPDPTR